MSRPGPLMKRVLRLPVFLHEIGAGRVLGCRFLLLTHRGRSSGRVYRTVLEVVSWDAELREAVVMSGFGRRSDWLLNVLSNGAQEVQIGSSVFLPEIRELGLDEAARVLAAYERRNRLLAPVVRVVLSRLAGFRYDGSDAARRKLLDRLPLVGLRDAVSRRHRLHAAGGGGGPQYSEGWRTANGPEAAALVFLCQRGPLPRLLPAVSQRRPAITA